MVGKKLALPLGVSCPTEQGEVYPTVNALHLCSVLARSMMASALICRSLLGHQPVTSPFLAHVLPITRRPHLSQCLGSINDGSRPSAHIGNQVRDVPSLSMANPSVSNSEQASCLTDVTSPYAG